MRATRAIIDLIAIRHNLGVVRQFAPESKVMAVVKADAYGHGIVQTAESLSEADAIAVACLDEAIKLRESGIQSDIILLEGFFSAEELKLAIEYRLDTVVHQSSQVDQLIETSESRAAIKENCIKIWVKFDTGMNRLGFHLDEFSTAFESIEKLPLVKEIGVMSHLACADDINNPMSKNQISYFLRAIRGLEAKKSMANSAGVVAWPESHFDWIRPGIMLYGCSPMIGLEGGDHHLLPAMTLESQLFTIHQIEAGQTVGYGATWTAKANTRIGVIAIGYGDGYPRHAKEGTPVLINGKKYPLVGKVSMDMITVDLGCEDEFTLGDTATLWGKGLPVEEVAKFADTIPYTLLCGVTSRVKFEWVDD